MSVQGGAACHSGSRFYIGVIGIILELCGDNGKDNGNYFSKFRHLGFRRLGVKVMVPKLSALTGGLLEAVAAGAAFDGATGCFPRRLHHLRVAT